MTYEELENLLDANGVEYPDLDDDQEKLAAWVIESFSS